MHRFTQIYILFFVFVFFFSVLATLSALWRLGDGLPCRPVYTVYRLKPSIVSLYEINPYFLSSSLFVSGRWHGRELQYAADGLMKRTCKKYQSKIPHLKSVPPHPVSATTCHTPSPRRPTSASFDVIWRHIYSPTATATDFWPTFSFIAICTVVLQSSLTYVTVILLVHNNTGLVFVEFFARSRASHLAESLGPYYECGPNDSFQYLIVYYVKYTYYFV